MKKVSGPQVVTIGEALESPLPAEIQEALGELVGAAREGLLALSVGVGLRVVHELMEAEVTEIVGPKGKHDLDRTAKRDARGRVDDLGWSACAGQPSADPDGRRRAGAAGCDV